MIWLAWAVGWFATGSALGAIDHLNLNTHRFGALIGVSALCFFPIVGVLFFLPFFSVQSLLWGFLALVPAASIALAGLTIAIRDEWEQRAVLIYMISFLVACLAIVVAFAQIASRT